MPRYVILQHNHPFLHWDLLLEQGDGCRTWRLLREPAADVPVPAEPLPDHRLHYLNYEGPVSGNRGTVQQWDVGHYEPAGAQEPAVRLQLRGNRGFSMAAWDPARGCWTFRSSPAE